MIYHCEKETIDVTDEKFKVLKSPYCETTVEGTSYKKDDFVYKIYYGDEYSIEEIGEPFLDERGCQKLTSITNLKHFFLPVGVIYDEDNKYAGCKAVFIKPLPPKEKRIIEKPVTVFLDEIGEVQNDLDILTENRVLVGDFGIHNMIDNGHVNIFDAGGYEVDFFGNYTKQQIKNRQFNELDLLLADILDEEIRKSCNNLVIKYMEKRRYIRDLYKPTGVLKMLEKEAISYGSIKEFVDDICQTKVKKR